jgi:hypothetical protein
MPKPKYKISDFLIRGLKWYLEVKVGYQLRTKLDCRKVAELITEETGSSVSESTLYRLFLWQGGNNTPYFHTLEIMAKFIGHPSWVDLENEINELSKFHFLYGTISGDKSFQSLMKFNIHSNSLRPLHGFLEQFPEDLDTEKRFLIGHEIYTSLKTNPNNNLDFFKNFQNVPIVRSSFFEFLADPDFSIPHYEQGLIHYLGDIKPHQSFKALQDYVFANSLLLRYYYKTENKARVIEIGKSLYLGFEMTEQEINSLHIYPRIRYLSYKLFYRFVSFGFDITYWTWLKEFAISHLQNNNTLFEQRIVIHTILDVLQTNRSLQLQIYDEFSLLFPEIFNKLPDYISKLTIDQKIKMMDPNAAIRYPEPLF